MAEMAQTRPKNRVRVYQPDAYEGIVENMDYSQKIPMPREMSLERSMRLNQTREMQRAGMGRTSSAESSIRRRKREKEALQARTMRYWDEASKREAEYQKQQNLIREMNKDKGDEKFRRMLEEMDSQQGFVDECSAYLRLKDENNSRKVDRMHRRWSSEVFLPIQERINGAVQKRSTSEVEGRRTAALQEYLTQGNTKCGVFRDIIDAREYDPLRLNRTATTYKSRDLDDPLKKDLTNLNNEKALMASIMSDGSDQKFARDHREMLDLLLWDKLDSTPYARYNGPPKPHVMPPGVRDPRQTNVTMDHYKIAKGPAFVKTEYFPAGKFIPPMANRPGPFGLDFPNGKFNQQRPVPRARADSGTS